MKNLTTYLFVMFMIMFWVFRIIVAVCFNLGVDFVSTPMDLNFEVILLFLTPSVVVILPALSFKNTYNVFNPSIESIV